MSTLIQQRLNAAIESEGISDDRIYASIERVIKDFSGDILDFGAGAGNLTKRLVARNPKSVTAADIVLNSIPGVHWISADLNEPLDLPNESFDLIVASEIIEHLENPRAVAREWFRLLKPGGTLVLSTPNNESIRSIFSLIMRGHFIAFNDSCYPAHITALVRKDISRILTEAGFLNIEFSFTNQGGLPKLPRVTWQQISFGLLKGLRFSDNIIVGALKSPSHSTSHPSRTMLS